MTTNLWIGATLLDRFRVENFIAAGGMATIYRVWDITRGVPLAMKVLHPELADDPAFIARFTREARALKSLSHPHIVPFYGLYKDGDLTFLLEQYIDGPSLDEVLRRRNGSALPVKEALVFFKALYTSLGYAHAQGIIHCDVKPGNVLIDQGGRVYLTDFGIARYAEATGTTSAIGTPVYMAPEQIRGEMAVPQTDVYSLGLVMYELLTGQRPFRADANYPLEAGSSQADHLRYAHLYQTPPNPRDFNPRLPPALAQALLKSLAKSPSERFANLQSMANAVFEAAGTRFSDLPDRVSLPPSQLQSPYRPNTDAGSPGTNPPPGSSLASRLPALPNGKKVRWPLLIGVVLVVLLCLLGSIGLVKGLSNGLAAGQNIIPPNIPINPTRTHTAPAQNTPTSPPASQTPTLSQPSPTPQPTAPSPTSGAGALDHPPAGTLAVVEHSGGIDRLFSLDLTNAQLSPIQGPDTYDWAWSPQWSPDGARLTWLTHFDKRPHVVVLDVASGNWQVIEAGEPYQSLFGPAWVGSGGQVSFWASNLDGNNDLVVADASTGQQTDKYTLPGYRNLFVWNWQSGQVAFARQVEGANQVVIATSPVTSNTPIDTGGESYAPAWSRDGQWLAFQATSTVGSGESEIFIIRADGSGMRQVTSSPPGSWSRAPTWSPDGKTIAYVSNQAGSRGADYGEIFIVDVATGKTLQITSTGGNIYDWRPDWRP